ncbi:MAG: glycerophosphodiester phosphodiesterase [Acetatifactor sp.]|nr:glycerophosphodiester phosphodiesterase [Acetatifactor sp.]
MTLFLIITTCILVLIVLYFLMIMPRMLGRPDISPFLEWMYAHRGFHDNTGDAPENSLLAFQRAVEMGFGIELDVQMSKDKIPVVFHDYTLERVCGVEGKVCERTLAELKELTLYGSKQRIPSLEEALRLVDGKVPLIVELKIEATDISVCPAADKLLSDYGGMYCIESFHPAGILWYRIRRKKVVRGQLADAFHKEGKYAGPLYFWLENLLFNWLGKPDFVAFNHKYPKMYSLSLCRELYSCTMAAWTIKSEEELQAAEKYFDIFIFDSFMPKRQGSGQ